MNPIFILIFILSFFIFSVFVFKKFHIFLAKRCDFSHPTSTYKHNGINVKEVNCLSIDWGWYNSKENVIYIKNNLPKFLKRYIISHEYCHSTYLGPNFSSVWSEIKCIFLIPRKNKKMTMK